MFGRCGGWGPKEADPSISVRRGGEVHKISCENKLKMSAYFVSYLNNTATLLSGQPKIETKILTKFV